MLTLLLAGCATQAPPTQNPEAVPDTIPEPPEEMALLYEGRTPPCAYVNSAYGASPGCARDLGDNWSREITFPREIIRLNGTITWLEPEDRDVSFLIFVPDDQGGWKDVNKSARGASPLTLDIDLSEYRPKTIVLVVWPPETQAGAIVTAYVGESRAFNVNATATLTT